MKMIMILLNDLQKLEQIIQLKEIKFTTITYNKSHSSTV